MPAYDILRLLVLAVGVAATLLALGSWAVTTGRIPAGTAGARLIRRLSDPILDPLEHWLIQRGRNPQDAPWWLLGLVIVGGIVTLTVAQWLIALAGRLLSSGRTGPRGWIRLVVYLLGQVVLFSLIARVIGSWMGVGRFHRWMRPAYRLTDWIVEPLQRFIPPLGRIDITPVVAWFLLQLLLGVILQAI